MLLPSRRSFLAGAALAPAAIHTLYKESATGSMTLFIGTYTSGKGISGKSKGIYSARWNGAAGELTHIEPAAETPNPTFLALGKGGAVLYAVNEIGNFQGSHDGSVSSWRVKPGTGKLEAMNAVDSGGDGPCHVAVDHTGQCVFAANYNSGSSASFRIEDGGKVSAAVSHFQYTGHGPNADRQESAHTHGVLLSPDNRFLLVNDLGLDRIMVYQLDPATAKLTPAAEPYFSVKPGSGPRHSLFHPNGRFVYCINELASTINVLRWEAKGGRLQLASSADLLPAGYPGAAENRAADMAIDHAGRFLYATNRGHDSVAVFSIDDASGALTLVERPSCGGKNPRHFALAPGGDWLLVANQDTNDIVIFRRDTKTGKVTPTGKRYSVDAPVCLVFAG